MPSVTAIFVTYNSADIIGSALASLKNQSAVSRIIVVDNASTDTTRDIIKRDYPAATLIENKTNEGYGRGNNIALEQVATDYALLINPDAIMKQGSVEALLAAAGTYPDAGLLAPMLYDEAGRLHRSYKRSILSRDGARDSYAVPDGDLCAEFLSGAVWLLDMKKLRQVGFFDPAIFLYYEDDDLCMRIREQGFGLVLVHAAKAIHLMGASSGAPSTASDYFKQKQTAWSRLYIEEKYHGAAAANKLKFRMRLFLMLKVMLYALSGNARKLNKMRGRLAGLKSFTAAA